MDGINCGCSQVTFIIFWAPVNELGCACVGVFLLCGAIASEVSLFSTVETCTLYPSLDSSILCSGYTPSWWTSSSPSPVSSWCSGSVEVHWDQLIVPCLWCSGGIEWGVETDVCMASPRLDSLTLRGSVEPAWTLLKGHLMLQDNYGLYTDIESTC